MSEKVRRRENPPALPGPQKLPLWERAVVSELLVSSGGLLSSVVLMANQWIQPSRNLWLVGLGFFFFVITVSGIFIKVRKAQREERSRTTEPVELSICARMVRSWLLAKNGLDASDSWAIRVSVYRRSPLGGHLQQCINYSGGGEDGGGRDFRDSSGIIGRAFQTKKAHFSYRVDNDFEEYKLQMIEEFGMPREQAEHLRQDRFGFAAVPLYAGSEVEGVIYVDARKSEYLDGMMRDETIIACNAVVEYVRDAYKGAR